jgi:hypothetical protein
MSDELNTLAPKNPFDIRDDLHDMIVRDLFGPAGEEDEELHFRERRVRDRYLVGLLAPRTNPDANPDAPASTTASTPDPEDVDMGVVDPDTGQELSETGSEVDASYQDTLARDTYDSEEEGNTDDTRSGKSSFFPSSMGMSFVVGADARELVVETSWGQYWKIESETQRYVNPDKDMDKPARVWKRQPVKPEPLTLPLVAGDIGDRQDAGGTAYTILHEDFPKVRLQGRMRFYEEIGWIVTLFLVNHQREPLQNKDSAWVFQPCLKVRAAAGSEEAIFVRRNLALHETKVLDRLSQQEHGVLEMQYRDRLDFAVGHGVSVHVARAEHDPTRALSIETTFLPHHDVAQQTPPTEDDIAALAGITLDMHALSELPKVDLLANLRQIVTAYEQWIEAEAAKLADPNQRLADHQDAFENVIAHCQEAKVRIQAGIDCLAEDDDALKAFRFTNHAMALQRVHTVFAAKVRRGERQPDDALDADDIPENRSWRLFQLAFILLNLPSLTDPHHPERSPEPEAVADLLWFPTGGGKTEAYLGLTAFTLAMRRLRAQLGGYDAAQGVGVLMRYTLRLLTLQQFQRAAALMCACEVLRREDVGLWGKTPFRLGLWVGSSSTPNHLRDAAEALKSAKGDSKPSASGSPQQLTHCPWCGREIKPDNLKVYHGKNSVGRCVTYCSDTYGRCVFSEKHAPQEGLPVLVVDEDIYRHPPALLIATVDKFAQMPWQGNVQMLFGRVSGLCQRHGFLSPDIEADDQHGCKGNHPKAGNLPRVEKQAHVWLRPPDLIIQDELHLISGPLGSMVGLYETAIDDLSTWQLAGQAVRPKVIASTATVRRAPDQVKRLFMRDVRIFPPQGSSIGDNFFSLERPTDRHTPGRRYLGVCAFGRRFTEALIRVYIACLGSGQTLYQQHDTNADPYLTLVGYFNSIRELAGAKRLSEDDIKARLRGDITNRRGFTERSVAAVEELTSRKSSQEIPRLLSRLEVGFSRDNDAARKAYRDYQRNKRKETGKKTGKKTDNPFAEQQEPPPPPPRPFDVVLATNMISVGVDIDRLGLMVAAGQPKNTAEYIQASSRVGRKAPGLVVTLYNWARPRDLSHFETFEHYHWTFYKHVEALSVTPFASRALDRGLAGVMTGMVRLHDTTLSANTAAQDLQEGNEAMAHMLEVLAQRAENVTDNPAVKVAVRNMLQDKRDYWLKKARNQRETQLLYKQGRIRKRGQENAVGLLERIEDGSNYPFAAMNSLRNVESPIPLIFDENAHGLSADDSDILVTEGQS